MKYDTALNAGFDPLAGGLLPGAAELAAALSLRPDKPIVVAGSTGPGEEELLLTAYAELHAAHPDLQLVLVPRKPERFDEVAALIGARGLACVRRSRCPDGSAPPPPAPGAVILGDTMGELRKFYALATVVFVGRSLVPMGGSDPMEAAALAKPVLVGPHMENFADAVEKLAQSGGLIVVPDEIRLRATIARLLDDVQTASAAGRAGHQTVLANTGATGRTVALVASTLREPA